MLENVVENIKSKYGTNYKFGQSSHAMYQVGGTLTDWVYSELNVTRTFLLELKSLYDDDEKGIPETICFSLNRMLDMSIFTNLMNPI